MKFQVKMIQYCSYLDNKHSSNQNVYEIVMLQLFYPSLFNSTNLFNNYLLFFVKVLEKCGIDLVSLFSFIFVIKFQGFYMLRIYNLMPRKANVFIQNHKRVNFKCSYNKVFQKILFFHFLFQYFRKFYQFQIMQEPLIYQANPSKDKIIMDKDQAIQQLIYQNIMLKRQLSQFTLRQSTDNNRTQSKLQSTNTSVRPSHTYLNTCKNSLQNSMDLRRANNIQNYDNSNSARQDFIIKQKNNMQSNIIPVCYAPVQRQPRSYRHSIDNCSYVQKNSTYDQMQNFKINNNQKPNNNAYNFTNNQNLINIANNNKSAKINHHQHQNSEICPQLNTYEVGQVLYHSNLNQQTQILEEQLYKEKMMKLKKKKSNNSLRLSQEKQNIKVKTENNKIYGHNQDNGLNLIQAHQTLKQKLYNQQKMIRVQNKCYEQKTLRKNMPDNKNQNKINTLKAPIDLAQKHQQENYTEKIKVISIDKNSKNVLEQRKMKNFMKFQPKQTLLKQRGIILNQQKNSKVNVKDNIPPHNQKQTNKICLKQLKGRIYLDDQVQTLKTKRSVSNLKSHISLSKTQQSQSHNFKWNQNTRFSQMEQKNQVKGDYLKKNDQAPQKSKLALKAKTIQTTQSQTMFIPYIQTIQTKTLNRASNSQSLNMAKQKGFKIDSFSNKISANQRINSSISKQAAKNTNIPVQKNKKYNVYMDEQQHSKAENKQPNSQNQHKKQNQDQIMSIQHMMEQQPTNCKLSNFNKNSFNKNYQQNQSIVKGNNNKLKALSNQIYCDEDEQSKDKNSAHNKKQNQKDTIKRNK